MRYSFGADVMATQIISTRMENANLGAEFYIEELN